MVMFKKPQEHLVKSQSIRMFNFHELKELYVTRPPYQRRVVWTHKKQQALLDSIFRGYYIPRLVMRRVDVGGGLKVEVIDGQQRITVVQRFFNNELALPNTLYDVSPDLAGKTYSELPDSIKRFVEEEPYDVDMVYGIENPRDVKHQDIAAEIFRRLQEGVSLNYMEKAHAHLDSRVRNFLVEYADDISFDFENYLPLDRNDSKHPFFSRVYSVKNTRMQHLALLCRLLMLEEADGRSIEVKNSDLLNFIAAAEVSNGIGDFSYKKGKTAQNVLRNLDFVYEVLRDDPQVLANKGMRQLSTEYFVLSVYLLLRHLRERYVVNDEHKRVIYDFVLAFHKKWKTERDIDANRDILFFSEKNQQTTESIGLRHQIIQRHFFEFAQRKGVKFVTKDARRIFNEAERAYIYQRDKGCCQMCLTEGLSPEEAHLAWNAYEVDHIIPHSRGGETTVENGQVLCRRHNRIKGASG